MAHDPLMNGLLIGFCVWFLGSCIAWFLFEDDLVEAHEIPWWPIAVIRRLIVAFWKTLTTGWR